MPLYLTIMKICTGTGFMRRNNTQSGFTLIELLVVIALLGVTAAIAVPSFGRLINSSQKSAFMNDMTGLLSYARSEAVRRNTRVVVYPRDVNNTSKGYSVCLEPALASCKSDPEQASKDEALLRTTHDLPSSIVVQQASNLIFDGRGMTDSGRTYEICGEYDTYAAEITVNSGGQIRAKSEGKTKCTT